jgi:hypothetical protein
MWWVMGKETGLREAAGLWIEPSLMGVDWSLRWGITSACEFMIYKRCSDAFSPWALQ